jgi:hypothetical protein
VPETLKDKEALALTHLGEHPIRTRDEVTTMEINPFLYIFLTQIIAAPRIPLQLPLYR